MYPAKTAAAASRPPIAMRDAGRAATERRLSHPRSSRKNISTQAASSGAAQIISIRTPHMPQAKPSSKISTGSRRRPLSMRTTSPMSRKTAIHQTV